MPIGATRFQSPRRPGAGLDPSMLVTTGLYNPQPGDPRYQAHQDRLRQLSEAKAGGGQRRPGNIDFRRPVLQGPSSLPGSRTGFLSQQMQQQRGARTGLGVRQGPPASQMRMAFPGQDPRRGMFGGRQFGQGTRTARSILQRGGAGLLGFGQQGRQPMSFGILGRGFGKQGQRRSPF